MVLKIVKTVWPVMLTYVAIGAPCGMIMAQTGMEPWMVFALSSTFVTGSGQFMVCNQERGTFSAPVQRIEFLTEPVCFFWYHSQTLR